MTKFQVDSDEVIALSSAVRGYIGRIQAETQGLSAQLTGLQSSWTGVASTTFQSAATDWRATQQRIEENLAAINHALSVAGQQYAEIEATNARLFAH